ncbi:MAG: response regulator, partial [Pseudomonadota bacterium]|nr:response regulator [Pseudomonadota bacterium]
PRPGPKPRQRPLDILLVEDNPINQRLATSLLEKHGHRVTVAGHGQEAVELAESRRFDLILMDIQMPELSGFQATEQIRARERQTGGHVPVVAMTAYAMPGDRERCLARGMDGYLAKPIRGEELLATLERLAGASLPPADRPPSPPATPVLDRAALLQNVENDTGLMHTVVGMFLDSIPRDLAALRAALEGNDPAALHKQAHTLKGLLGTVGAAAAAGVAQQLEEAPPAEAGPLLARLEAEVQRLLPELEELRETAGPAGTSV